ncbi:hypothetical protein Cgig2_030747 [Carnegiea gigantea]|uniref:DUF4283 domain-containing protein n=1 Tax=Carnegiea gigantea TaxID=171969 RepID=A0A9Q1QPE2_9CARY|nr:hypothetical protein Cgig2_030747 [Carnegiea gigantea]
MVEKINQDNLATIQGWCLFGIPAGLWVVVVTGGARFLFERSLVSWEFLPRGLGSWCSFPYSIYNLNFQWQLDWIEEAWQKLKLTAEEESVVVADEEEDAEKNAQIALCLLGRLHTDTSFNIRAMKSVFCNIWKPVKGLVMRDLETNLFAFQFFSMADKDYVLNEGPWAFDGHILLLKQMTSMEIPSDVEFKTAHFLVKAYDVPGKKQTASFAKLLASNMRELVSCDETTMVGVDKALCF